MSKPLALVTGASAGIGAAYARALAARGHDLVLVARREEPLRALAADLASRHGVRADVVCQDLLDPGASRRLFDETEGAGRPVGFLVNNAGFGQFGAFTESDEAQLARMLALDVVAFSAIAHVFAGPMRQRSAGVIVNVASVAAFQAVPWFAAYSAAKAYVLSLSEALAVELRPVQVQALCPGPTATEFFEVSGTPKDEGRIMSAEDVVRESLEGVDAGRAVVVPGLRNRVMVAGSRMAPRWLVTKLAGKMMASR